MGQCCGNCCNFSDGNWCESREIPVTEWSFPDLGDYCGCPFYSSSNYDNEDEEE